ncbi:MAG TPA: hypothetical protein VGA69_04910 [Nitriliruptorales bacterium]
MILRRRPPLPADLHAAWRGFVDCAEVVEGGRRTLLGTLPVGRLDPAPVGVGLDAMHQAIRTARDWMPRWRIDDLEDQWQACQQALTESETGLEPARRTAATTAELEALLGSVEEVVVPLDAFADAERRWRDGWKLPREDR